MRFYHFITSVITLVVIKTEEDFWSYVERGYTPYLMKSQNRWYLRRGQRRHIIARELEGLASMVIAKLKAKQGPSVPAGVIQEMRRQGATVASIVEDTGLSRSAVYGAFEREPEELVKTRRTARAVQISERLAEIEVVQKVRRVLKEVRLLGRLRREKKGCFDAEEGICMRGISEGVGGLELVKHEHLAPIPFVPPAVDFHVKPDLEFCAFCPFSYEYSYEPSIFEACLKASRMLKDLI